MTKLTLEEFIIKRRQKADKLENRGLTLQQRDLLSDIDRGMEMEAEALARKDELGRIFDAFCEKGD